ncbi:MAG TPA: hypothetical protein GX505_11650 [Clostridiales bacterium]|nr:hypothetical protein [Clostridiales bacterium]
MKAMQNKVKKRTFFRVLSMTLVLTLGLSLFQQVLPFSFAGRGNTTAQAMGSGERERPLVGVINYSGLTGQNKTYDEISLTPPQFNHRLPFYAVREYDTSRLARNVNTVQEIVYYSETDITNVRIYAAFDDSKPYDENNDIKILTSPDGITYTEAPSPGLSGKSATPIKGAENWQKVNISSSYEFGIHYVKIQIAKTDDTPLNPQIMRIEYWVMNEERDDLIRTVDNLDDFSKMHSYSEGLTLVSDNPENFLLVAADDNEPDIVAQQIAYAKSAQIDYIAYLDMETNWHMPYPRVFDLFRKNPDKGDLKYCVIMGAPTGNYENWENRVDRILEYFADSFYVRVHDNRPLFYIMNMNNWSKSHIDYLRSQSIAAGLGNPYVVGMTNQSYYADFLDGASDYAAVEAGVVYNYAGTSNTIPLVSLGVNDEPRHLNPPSWGAWGPIEDPISTEQLKSYVKSAMDWTAANPDKNPANTILIYAWNEHAEAASNIEPTLNSDGTINTVYLDALGDAISSWDNEPDDPDEPENLLSNPGFEEGLTGWSWQSANVSITTDSVNSGSRAAYVSGRTGQWGSPVMNVLPIMQTKGQGVYRYGAYARFIGDEDDVTMMLYLESTGNGPQWYSIWPSAHVGTEFTNVSGQRAITWSGTLTKAELYIQTISSTADMVVDDFYFGFVTDDITAPSAITDLAAGDPTSSSLTLTWTAPGDDGNVGTAARYDIRYASFPIDASNVEDSGVIQITNPPTPLEAGTTQEFTISGLDPDTTYYFVIFAIDNGGNYSPISNTASGSTIEYIEGTTNLALTASVSASETDDGYSAAGAIDGNTGDFQGWATNPFADDDWLMLEWTTPQTISRVDIYSTTGYLFSGYTIQVWDGSGWVDIISTGNTDKLKTTRFSPVTTTKLRILGMAGDMYGIYRIDEIEVYGAAPPEETTNLLTNPGFEDGLTGWSGFGGTLNLTTDNPHSGTYAALISNRSDDWHALSYDVRSLLEANGPGIYRFGMHARYLSGSGQVFMIIDGEADSGFWAAGWPLTEVGSTYVEVVAQTKVNWTGSISNARLRFQTIGNNADIVVDDFFMEYVSDDIISPSAVTDLAVSEVSDTSITLTWTAPGDDGDVGTASVYEIFYSDSPTGDGILIDNPPVPQPAGSTQTVTITGLNPGSTYYFHLYTGDEVGNFSSISNKVSGVTTNTAQDNADISAAKGTIEAAFPASGSQEDIDDIEAARAAVEAIIAELDLNGVTAEVEDGTFTAATAGTAASPAGTNGSYTFTVSLSKGAGTAQTTALLTFNIEALPYDNTQDNADISAAKGTIEAAFPASGSQEDIDDIEAARAAVEAIIAELDLNGVTAEVEDGTFTAALAGTAASPAGTDGSYTFTVTLSKGAGIAQTTALLTFNIEALPYENDSAEDGNETPKTGDTAFILIWLLLCILAAASVIRIKLLKQVKK